MPSSCSSSLLVCSTAIDGGTCPCQTAAGKLCKFKYRGTSFVISLFFYLLLLAFQFLFEKMSFEQLQCWFGLHCANKSNTTLVRWPLCRNRIVEPKLQIKGHQQTTFCAAFIYATHLFIRLGWNRKHGSVLVSDNKVRMSQCALFASLEPRFDYLQHWSCPSNH